MNGLLWLGIISTTFLLVSLVFDGAGDAFDLFDALEGDWLSLPAIAAFFGAFGFVAGALIDSLGPVALVAGVVAGILFAFGAIRLSRGFRDMPTDRTETEADLLASLGRIVVAPAPGRYGEVLLTRPTGPVKVACIADDELPAGTPVVVVDVRSSTLVAVEPFDDGTT
ncbi:MAG: NfeD family protein [Aquihabitans sp.]